MMKKYLVLSAAMILVSLITACRGEVKIYTDPAMPIEVKVRHEFIIATSSNPSTGYMWREEFDENMLELKQSIFEISEAVKRGEAQVGLEQHFHFKALKKGTTEVEINLLGPSLQWITEQKKFTVNIK